MTAPYNRRRSASKGRKWLWGGAAAVGAAACALAVGIAVVDTGSPSASADPLHPGSGTPRTTVTRGDSATRTAAGRSGECTVSAMLVPSCGLWWGVTPGAFSGQPPQQALRTFERRTGRTVDVFHSFHKGGQLFPTPAEIAIAREPGKNRRLLVNWKPDVGETWAKVAAGSMDAHIDRLSGHIKRNYPERFWLVIHHEPEEEVRLKPGSGYTPADYSRMFRHVVQRFRANGVKNALFTVAYRGYSNWTVKPWFMRLYPGADVVDWVAFDPYVKGAEQTPDFASLIDKAGPLEHDQGFPGFYTWSQSRMPGKPLMIAEWGVLQDRTTPEERVAFFHSVAAQISRFPRLKALVYFEAPHGGLGDSQVHTDPQTLRAFRRLGRNPVFNR
ncbi:MAG TPA: glycosyl hydrolase [Actinomadura sp.]|nr:glycosyl hydrolase [Actinomadura sp.]